MAKTKKQNDSRLKDFLKTLKLNEETISMVLGALVIVVIGVLIVNYFRGKNDETITEEAVKTTETQKAEVGKNHTVVSGETLWSIAEDAYGSGYNWTDIYNDNKLTDQNVRVGQVLNIPNVPAKKPTSTKAVSTIAPSASPAPTASASPSPTATSTATPTSSPKGTASATPSATATSAPSESGTNATSYTVAKGDSLWKIAVAQYGDGYKWVEIARANKLANPNVIHAGNQLTLPR